MVVLGVDFGDARMGLASCDPGEILATLLETVNVKGVRDAANQASQKAKDIGAGLIVVGMPIRTDGTRGDRAEKTEAFMQMLRELSGLEVESFDERYTSVVAHRFLSDSGLSTKKHKSLVDAVSAALILQDYLDAKKQKNNNP